MAGGAPKPWTRDPTRPAGARPHRAPAGRRRQRDPPSPATERRQFLWPPPLPPQASTWRPRPLRPPQPGLPFPAPTCTLGNEPVPVRAVPKGCRERAPFRGGARLWERLSGLLVSMRSRAHFWGELRFSGSSQRCAQLATQPIGVGGGARARKRHRESPGLGGSVGEPSLVGPVAWTRGPAPGALRRVGGGLNWDPKISPRV